jgi:hypothetical protein
MVLAVKKRLRKRIVLVLPILIVFGLCFLFGCAGGLGITSQNQGSTKPLSYTVTVTGAYGPLQHSVPVTLIVQ